MLDVLKACFWSLLLPGVCVAFYVSGLIAIATLKVWLVVSFVVFFVLPLIFKYSYKLHRGVLFLTYVSFPRNVDYSKPESVGVEGTRNFYIRYKYEDEDLTKLQYRNIYKENENPKESLDRSAIGKMITLGVWHILPSSLAEQYKHDKGQRENVTEGRSKDNLFDSLNSVLRGDVTTLDYYDPESNMYYNQGNVHAINADAVTGTSENVAVQRKAHYFEQSLGNGLPVILYLHGNSGSRASGHRVELYKMLRALNYHIIAVDYRGYGDSSRLSPTELGLVMDAVATYKWITQLTTGPVFVWGHSLGTGVSTHLLSVMNDRMVGPKGLILESPFNNISDEIREHPFSIGMGSSRLNFFRNLPWFNSFIVQPMHDSLLRFESDKHINNFKQPVLILHAEDDLVVPFKLGYKLYTTALEQRQKSWGPVSFHRFEASERCGHKYICRSLKVPNIVKNFVEDYKNKKY